MTPSLIIPCSSCATLNRIPTDRREEIATCASCHQRLLDREPHDVDSATLATLVDRSDLPVVVDFWASWCGPCRTMAPHFAAAARELRGWALLVKLDTEAEPEVATAHAISSIPTLIVFHRGRELARTSGAMPSAQLVRWVESGIC